MFQEWKQLTEMQTIMFPLDFLIPAFIASPGLKLDIFNILILNFFAILTV